MPSTKNRPGLNKLAPNTIGFLLPNHVHTRKRKEKGKEKQENDDPIMKRARPNAVADVSDSYASTLRMGCARAIERLEKQRELRLIDRLMILYSMHFLDTHKLPPLYVQTQRNASDSLWRINRPELFDFITPLELLENAIAEQSSSELEDCVQELTDLMEIVNMGVEEGGGMEMDDGAVDVEEIRLLAGSGSLWGLCVAYIHAVGSLGAVASNLEPMFLQQVDAILDTLSPAEIVTLSVDAEAIAACPVTSSSSSSSSAVSVGSPTAAPDGIDRTFYRLVHSKAALCSAGSKLRDFSNTFRRDPPPLNAEQQAVLHARAQEAADAAAAAANGIVDGVALDFVPDEAYMKETLQKAADGPLAGDEEFLKDEVHDYHTRAAAMEPKKPLHRDTATKQNALQERRSATAVPSGSGLQNIDPVTGKPVTTTLVKPHRYCKLKTGYTWSQYNLAHYNKRNPPPRVVMWYEFTLFYPALAKNKNVDLRSFFRIEDVEKGFNEEYCLLVFSPGPPYADVAYRIVRKQWDPKPGGVRVSFDHNGKFKLFFRFSRNNYRR